MRTIALLVLSTLMFAATSSAQKKPVVLNGELVEVHSYVKENIRPDAGAAKEISAERARSGGMLALLDTKSKRLTLVASDTTFLRQAVMYFGTRVAIKGLVYTRGGVSVIVPESIGKSIK